MVKQYHYDIQNFEVFFIDEEKAMLKLMGFSKFNTTKVMMIRRTN